MRLPSCWISWVAFYVVTGHANTEKTIFIAPSPVQFMSDSPGFEDLGLKSLSPALSTLRTSLDVDFPTAATPQGVASWILLRDLSWSRRYELRICWIANQPTEFWLDIYNVSHVLGTPDLLQSLAAYSERAASAPREKAHRPWEHEESALFLRIHAAADYFTSNTTLMQSPPPVEVDIILDPYVVNVFPRSLIPTAGYILALAIGSWFLSDVIWRNLTRFQAVDREHSD